LGSSGPTRREQLQWFSGLSENGSSQGQNLSYLAPLPGRFWDRRAPPLASSLHTALLTGPEKREMFRASMRPSPSRSRRDSATHHPAHMHRLRSSFCRAQSLAATRRERCHRSARLVRRAAPERTPQLVVLHTCNKRVRSSFRRDTAKVTGCCNDNAGRCPSAVPN